jgi:hypothetical protein
MKIEELQREWHQDAQINDIELDNESLKIPVLHSKYLNIMTDENKIFYKMSTMHDVLIKEKSEYYLGTMCEEDLAEREWEPYGLKVLKQDLPRYIGADEDVINSLLGVSDQRDKGEFLKSILQVINNRSFHIQNAINWRKFTNGLN